MTRDPFEPHDDMPEQNDTPRSDLPSGTPSPAGSLDELALRRLLHDAVRDVEPQQDALDQLSRAVPARRARRRQAMVGAAAGVLLVGTAVPAVLHVTLADSDAAAVHAAGTLVSGSDPATLGGELPGDTVGPPKRGVNGVPGVSPQASTPGLGSGASSSASDPADTPTCSRAQLGQGSAHTDAADGQGRVYGTFRVVNVSASSCAIVGTGQISVTAQGATHSGSIQVVAHTEGDPATALLPNPADDPAAVVLPPGQAYQVQFAWIPASGGGTTGCASDPPPPSGGGTGTTGGGSGNGSTGTTGDTGDSGGTDASGATTDGTSNGANALTSTSATDDGGVPSSGPTEVTTPTPGDSGIALSTVPPEGGPAAATTDISGACAGTVYQTDPLPTP